MPNGLKLGEPYRILLSDDSRKYYQRLTDSQARRVDFAFSKISRDPYRGGDIKKLTGMKGFYRLRIGDLRAIFEIQEWQKTLWIDQLLPRGQAYK